MEVIRFLTVAVIGLLIDLMIAWALATALGLPLWICAGIGFVVAAGGNYALHERWTFRREGTKLSGPRAVQYLGVSVATLLIRLAVVAALSYAFATAGTLEILIAGAGVSFFFNFVLSKFLVFTRTGMGPETGTTRP